MTSAILFACFAVLLIFNVPIAVSLGISSIVAMLYDGIQLTTL